MRVCLKILGSLEIGAPVRAFGIFEMFRFCELSALVAFRRGMYVRREDTANDL